MFRNHQVFVLFFIIFWKKEIFNCCGERRTTNFFRLKEYIWIYFHFVCVVLSNFLQFAWRWETRRDEDGKKSFSSFLLLEKIVMMTMPANCGEGARKTEYLSMPLMAKEWLWKLNLINFKFAFLLSFSLSVCTIHSFIIYQSERTAAVWC